MRWLTAVVVATRPRQWPKNLLVFAAPLAGATVGRPDGLGYALLAAVAFGAASSAVYLVNDVVDAERDRRHPVKRHRPIAAGDLSPGHALALAALAASGGVGVGVLIGEPLLAAAAAGYLAMSFLYSARLKHVPYVELTLVAAGFLLRVLGGAAATHVRPSAWFLLVCGLGALGVAVGKRYAELASLGAAAVRHRPAMRWYRLAPLRSLQLTTCALVVVSYLAWATGERDGTRLWHVLSAVPLALALVRFAALTARRTARPVEEMITGDVPMLACELAWLGLFCAGLAAG